MHNTPLPWLASTWTNERWIVLARVYPNVCFLRIHVRNEFSWNVSSFFKDFLQFFFSFLFHEVTTRGNKFVQKRGNSFFRPCLINLFLRVCRCKYLCLIPSAFGSENFSSNEFKSNIVTEYWMLRTTSRVHCLTLLCTQVFLVEN